MKKRAVRESAALKGARIDLAAALRWASRLGFGEGVCNHFSLAVPGSADRYLINPHGVHWREVQASDLCVVAGDGRLVAGRHAVEPTAFFIHSRVHRARPDAGCVMHTHMPYATAICALAGGRLLPMSQNSLRFVGRIAYDDEFGGYRGLALDEEEGDRIARALADKSILFLANHGVLVTGPSVAACFDDLYYLERAATVQVLALSTGMKPLLVADELARRTVGQFVDENAFADLHFAALKRLLDRDERGYRR